MTTGTMTIAKPVRPRKILGIGKDVLYLSHRRTQLGILINLSILLKNSHLLLANREVPGLSRPISPPRLLCQMFIADVIICST